jgi:hypothetical protein
MLDYGALTNATNVYEIMNAGNVNNKKHKSKNLGKG